MTMSGRTRKVSPRNPLHAVKSSKVAPMAATSYTNDSARHRDDDSREFQILEDLIYTQHTMMNLDDAKRDKMRFHDLDSVVQNRSRPQSAAQNVRGN